MIKRETSKVTIIIDIVIMFCIKGAGTNLS